MSFRLVVTTTELKPEPKTQLTDFLDAQPLAFIRNGQGLVGQGEVLRLESVGSNRMQDLADQWRKLVAEAKVEDSVGLPGTGLVALGAVTFADNSRIKSVLIIPSQLIGCRDGRWWQTNISVENQQSQTAETGVSNPTPSRETESVNQASVTLQSGAQSAQGFKDSVEKALVRISAGELEKVVLARDLTAEVANDFSLKPALQKLTADYSSCWVYCVDGTFGASPELLVRVAHGQVSARVLAGTAGRGTDRGIDQAIAAALTASPKNSAEHAFAVDSMVMSLAPFCKHVDADPEPFSLALPNLWHLASDVYGVLLENTSVLDVASAIHPTAAVAGTPRLEAQKLIAELEPFDRGRYAGPVGWIGADGDGEWVIALRGAQYSKDALGAGRAKITAFAGCGIVTGSEPEAELAETELKFAPIRSALEG